MTLAPEAGLGVRGFVRALLWSLVAAALMVAWLGGRDVDDEPGDVDMDAPYVELTR